MDDRHADDVEDINEAVEVAVERPGEPEVEQLVHRLPEDPEPQQDPAVAVGSREHAEVDEEEEEVEEVVNDELHLGAQYIHIISFIPKVEAATHLGCELN